VAALIGLGAHSTLDAQSVAYIDSQVILAEAPGAQEAQAEFTRFRQTLETEAERLGTELEQLISAYQQQESLLNPSVRATRQEEIRSREERYQTRLQEMDQELAATRNRLLEPIVNQMTQVIESIRAAAGYSIVFDTAGQSIVAADPALDITSVVLTRLRLDADGGASATPPASAPAATPGGTP
jgi:outer membrane protein